VLRLAVSKTGLTQTYESTGRYMINTHSFRAYGITKLSRHDPNFAKKIAGQKGYLLEYDRISDEEKLDVYEKYEHELTIDESEKQRARIERLAAENSDVSKLKLEMKELREMLKSQGNVKRDINYYNLVDEDNYKEFKELIEKYEKREIKDD